MLLFALLSQPSLLHLSCGKKILCTLDPITSVQCGILAFYYQEVSGGSRWSNLFTPISPSDSFCLGYVFLMLIADTILFMVLTIYFENIIPSEYGLRKPWYYPFKLLNCRKSIGRVTPEVVEDETKLKDQPGFEPEPTDLHAGVVIHNLRKEFGRNKVAVNMVGTLKMYDGQITALLGHNGAGKTTTLSILTGLFAPTSGTATVNGYDIKENMDEIRKNLGLCPQHNMLFTKLTVQEHLIFFGRLKGLTEKQAIEISQDLLWRMHLLDKIDVQARALSGGQKRKLCLGMALIGGTKVVVLDEPTSGMDPEARRAIWDLLLGMRGERTIILTTHFMEEADVLGDRIAIMADGQVKCCGTPAFLRKYYGAGYTLKLTVADPSARPNILWFVQKSFPQASFKNSQSGNAAEVHITIPIEKNTNSRFPGFFSGLANEQQQLGIQTVGLSLATMDDIFVKVGHDAGIGDDDDDDEAPAENVDVTGSGTDDEGNYRQRVAGFKLLLQQTYGIFVKRMWCSLRKWKGVLCQVVLPIILLILCLLLSNSVFGVISEGTGAPDIPPLKMKLADYQKPVTLFLASSPALESAYATAAGPSNKVVAGNVSLTATLLNNSKQDLNDYRNRYIVAGDLSESNATAYYSALPNHASPLSVNLMSNAILRSMTPPNTNYKIEVTTHPLWFSSDVERLLRSYSNTGNMIATLFGTLLTVGIALLVAFFVVAPVEEKQTKAKQLQLMTGVNPAVYWTASFILDFCTIFLITCLVLLCFPIVDRYGIYTANHGAGVLFLIFITYGFAGISFSYLCSTFLKSVAGAFAFVTVVHIATGIVISSVFFAMESMRFFPPAFLYYIFRIFPTFGATRAIMLFTAGSWTNMHCPSVPAALLTVACDPSSGIYNNYRHCCKPCINFMYRGEEVRCQPDLLLRWWWSKGRSLDLDDLKIYYTPGISQEILYMFIIGIVYIILLMLIELGLFNYLFSKTVQADPATFAQATSIDQDVQLEKERVNELVASGLVAENALVVDNLCKSYGAFAAVSGLSFGVYYGECFGLLGVNGAGKTTTFRMLTGDEIRSFGNAYNMGLSLDDSLSDFLSRIGYCPQFDSIIGVLTGKEMVALFARLRGIPLAQVDGESTKWLFKVGLLESANVQCQKYSGGMKRRLCAAIALVGEPPVILLDEPTTGVDPVARRQFWKVIDSVRRSGQAVVLTSHSMEECEALCSRLGIMVNGQFQCLGGVQHLKAKFAQGFKLVVTLNKVFPEHRQAQPQKPVQNAEEEEEEGEEENEQNEENDQPQVQTQEPLPEPDKKATDEKRVNLLCDEILKTYNPCFLRERHQRMLEFQVIGIGFRWGQMFSMMEGIRAKFEELIEDYSITETTLEEVFLAFARVQYPEREVQASCLKKCCKC